MAIPFLLRRLGLLSGGTEVGIEGTSRFRNSRLLLEVSGKTVSVKALV